LAREHAWNSSFGHDLSSIPSEDGSGHPSGHQRGGAAALLSVLLKQQSLSVPKFTVLREGMEVRHLVSEIDWNTCLGSCVRPHIRSGRCTEIMIPRHGCKVLKCSLTMRQIRSRSAPHAGSCSRYDRKFAFQPHQALYRH